MGRHVQRYLGTRVSGADSQNRTVVQLSRAAVVDLMQRNDVRIELAGYVGHTGCIAGPVATTTQSARSLRPAEQIR
ncbi:MAG TPA: hypothetical protein VE666_18475 [Mycobacterium sp.]|nr:hypothetical protein [Mycobacterium sp.]